MAALVIVVLCTALVTWSVNGQEIVRQPVDAEGTEGETSQLSMDVLVSNVTTTAQVMASRRESEVVIDGSVKREGVFTSLGLDSSKYSVSETFNTDDGTMEYRLKISNPTRIDSAAFTFLVCRRDDLGRCNENEVQLTSASASFLINYVPSESFPNCTSNGPNLPPGSFGDGDGERVLLGEDTVLTCLSELGRPPVQLAWEKNGAGVTTDSEDAGAYRYGRHTFTPTLSDEGAVFVCNMTPGLTGPDYPSRTCALDINVVSTPTVAIVFENTNGYLVTGSTVLFTCSATTETSTINATEWYVPEELRNMTDRYEINDNQFTLKQVELADNNIILSCTVTDNDGMQEVEPVMLQVLDADDLPTDPVTDVITTSLSSTTNNTPSEDYTAIIIGSVFAGLLLIIFVVMIILFYWRKRQEKQLKPMGHASGHEAKRTTMPPGTKQAFNNHESKTAVARQNGANAKRQDGDQDVLGYNDPDVVPRGSHATSPERRETVEKQSTAPSRTHYEDIPLEDRHPAAPTRDMYRYDTDYDRLGNNVDDGVFIDSEYPKKSLHQDAETGENRYQYPDHRRYDDGSDRPPSEGGNYKFDNRGCEYEHSDGRYDDRYSDNNEGRSWSSDGDHRQTYEDRAYEDGAVEDRPYDDRAYDDRAYDDQTYNDRAYDDRAYDDRPYDEEPYSRDEGGYEDGYRRDSYDQQYDNRYGDYGKPDYDREDLPDAWDGPYRHTQGSYDRRTPSDYSEQGSYGGSYDGKSPAGDGYGSNAGMYTLQDNSYDDNPSYV